jgi:hypothetical protein
MSKIQAYCGLRCDTCPIYLATKEKDDDRRFEMRISIASLINKQHKMNLEPEDISDCDGCLTVSGRLFNGCIHCEIRKCVIEKNIVNCAYCDDFGCENLQKHFCLDPESLTRFEQLREK